MRMFPDGDSDNAVMFILLSNGSVSILALTHTIYTHHLIYIIISILTKVWLDGKIHAYYIHEKNL